MKIEEQPYDGRHEHADYTVTGPARRISYDAELAFFWQSGAVTARLGRASVGDLRSIDTVDLMVLQAHLEGAAAVVRRSIEARR